MRLRVVAKFRVVKTFRGDYLQLLTICHVIAVARLADDPGAEIDISDSKLLGFETFANLLRVSVSENLVSEKKPQFRFRKIWF